MPGGRQAIFCMSKFISRHVEELYEWRLTYLTVLRLWLGSVELRCFRGLPLS